MHVEAIDKGQPSPSQIRNPFFKADICDKGDSAYSRFLIGHYCVFSISNLLY